MDEITITRPDDWHAHFRDGENMASVVVATARQFARAIVMPNLKPPVATAAQAKAYHGRIMKALPKGADFEPLMSEWYRLTVALNSLNRSMGLLDAYPFAIAEAVAAKLHFVHDLVQRSGKIGTNAAAGPP